MPTCKPSEKNVYADIKAAYLYLRDSCGVPASDIILFGVSIGTAPTVHLASRRDVGGVILQSGFTSAVRLVRPGINRTWFFDAFPSIDRVSRVRAPVLVIHGTRDELVSCAHGEALFERCPRAVQPLWVEGAGHGDLPLYPQYFPRLRRFVDVEVRG